MGIVDNLHMWITAADNVDKQPSYPPLQEGGRFIHIFCGFIHGASTRFWRFSTGGTVLSSQSFILSLFPFAMPLQTLGEVDSNQVVIYIYVALIEITIIALVEWLILIIRRKVE